MSQKIIREFLSTSLILVIEYKKYPNANAKKIRDSIEKILKHKSVKKIKIETDFDNGCVIFKYSYEHIFSGHTELKIALDKKLLEIINDK